MRLFFRKVIGASILLVFNLLFSTSILAQSVPVEQLTAAPILDGSDSDWQDVQAISISLMPSGENVTVGVSSASIKAGVYEDELFVFIKWQDATKDDQHKPFVWDTEKNKYGAGPQREDRLALQFEMSGDYTVNWLSGKSFVADMWHWKAARSNPLDLMHDKMTIISNKPAKKAYKATAEDGSTIYIQRPGDKGDKLYTTKRYSKKENNVMPKYILAKDPQGSVADVHCKGVWKDGAWYLEIKRMLDTGHGDDIVFSEGKTVKAGLAVFDHTGDDNHVISETFNFKF